MSFINSLSNEILEIILEFLPAKTLLNLSETCKEAKDKCLENGRLWRRLSKIDFQVELKTLEPFGSFAEFYQLVYKAAVVHEIEIVTGSWNVHFPKKEMFAWYTLRRDICAPKLRRHRFSLLNRAQIKSIWGLKEEDLPFNKHGMVYRRCNVSWADAYDCALKKVKSIEEFQSAILKKFWKCNGKIDRIFEQSLERQRYNKYLDLRLHFCSIDINTSNIKVRNQSLFKDVITNRKATFENGTFKEMLQIIGIDYIADKLRFGMMQVQEYLSFISQIVEKVLKAKVVSESSMLSTLTMCILLTYTSFRDSLGVFRRLVSATEFLDESQTFSSRINEIMNWQGLQGKDFKDKYADDIQNYESFELFIKTGNLDEFSRLKTYFEGKHKLNTWINKCCWIQDILNKSVVEMLRGETKTSTKFPEVKMNIDMFLSNGTTSSFRGVVIAVHNSAKDSLEYYNHMLSALKNRVDSDYTTDEDLAISSTDIFQHNVDPVPWNLIY